MDGDTVNSIALSTAMKQYFTTLHTKLNESYALATTARSQGHDPTFTVEIPQALDLAARVEKLVCSELRVVEQHRVIPGGLCPTLRPEVSRSSDE